MYYYIYIAYNYIRKRDAIDKEASTNFKIIMNFLIKTLLHSTLGKTALEIIICTGDM